MIKSKFIVVLISTLYSLSSHALSPDAIEGKVSFRACNICHNQAIDPPLGPPMWGVQRRYKRNSLDKDDFIKSMVEFVKAPSMEKALHTEAINRLGLMPQVPLPEKTLIKIATYIFEENFQPPCDHWRNAVISAVNSGDMKHAIKDQNQLIRFCNK